MERLKLCPFCGKKPRVWFRQNFLTHFAIGCDTSTCMMWIPKDIKRSELHTYATCFRDKKHAIECWNARYDDERIAHMTNFFDTIGKIGKENVWMIIFRQKCKIAELKRRLEEHGEKDI